MVAVSVSQRIASDDQLARLLQIGIVLEEVVEARAHHHYRGADADLDDEIEALLADAAEESADHRERLESLIEGLGVDSVPFDEIESLVDARYGSGTFVAADAENTIEVRVSATGLLARPLSTPP